MCEGLVGSGNAVEHLNTNGAQRTDSLSEMRDEDAEGPSVVNISWNF